MKNMKVWLLLLVVCLALMGDLASAGRSRRQRRRARIKSAFKKIGSAAKKGASAVGKAANACRKSHACRGAAYAAVGFAAGQKYGDMARRHGETAAGLAGAVDQMGAGAPPGGYGYYAQEDDINMDEVDDVDDVDAAGVDNGEEINDEVVMQENDEDEPEQAEEEEEEEEEPVADDDDDDDFDDNQQVYDGDNNDDEYYYEPQPVAPEFNSTYSLTMVAAALFLSVCSVSSCILSAMQQRENSKLRAILAQKGIEYERIALTENY